MALLVRSPGVWLARLDELSDRILYYLDPVSLARAECVSRAWRATVRRSPVWRWMLQERLVARPDWALLHRLVMGPTPDVTRAHPWLYRMIFQRYFRDTRFAENNWLRGFVFKKTIHVGGNGVYCLQYDPDKLICGTRTHIASLYDLPSWRALSDFHGHEGSVLCLQVRL
jgi:hypothetical protein